MGEDIPYNKAFDLIPGRATEVAPGVRALVANDPVPVYLQRNCQLHHWSRRRRDRRSRPEDDAHVAALLDAVRGENVTAIFVTHTHRDHSPATPRVEGATGATVYAEGPHRAARPLHIGETAALDVRAATPPFVPMLH